MNVRQGLTMRYSERARLSFPLLRVSAFPPPRNGRARR